jgi:hypothetical protein
MPKRIVHIYQGPVNTNVQQCAKLDGVITNADEILARLRSRLRKTRNNVRVVRAKVLAQEPFPAPVPGWNWARVLGDMEETLRETSMRARALRRTIRLARTRAAAGDSPVENREAGSALTHNDADRVTLKKLAHENVKDTIDKAGKGRSPDGAATEGTGGALDPPDGYRTRTGRPSGDGRMAEWTGGARGEEGPEFARAPVARHPSHVVTLGTPVVLAQRRGRMV